MSLRTITADENKIWAYTDENGNIIKLSRTLYLGINDNGSRYYQIDDIEEVVEIVSIEQPKVDI